MRKNFKHINKLESPFIKKNYNYLLKLEIVKDIPTTAFYKIYGKIWLEQPSTYPYTRPVRTYEPNLT